MRALRWRQRQRHVAGHRDDAEHLQLRRRGQRQQDGDSVVLAGIGVDDDRAGHGRGAAQPTRRIIRSRLQGPPPAAER